ncbi:Dienelactone hydrolase OS=Streptomyces alboniger OX=132473 GN=CP975_09025 PE=4 SV=1 [Streptomyces alboniger]
MNIMLFHSTYGLRPAVHAAADRLRAAGHGVVDPRPLRGPHVRRRRDGKGLQRQDRQGRAPEEGDPRRRALSERGLVFSGFALGAATAQTLALGDARARGLLLLHGTSDIAENAPADDLPVQLHVAEPKPFETDDWLSASYLRMGRAGADVEVYRYAGAGHLYTDPDLDDYDAQAAEATWRTALGFLETLRAARPGLSAPGRPPARPSACR